MPYLLPVGGACVIAPPDHFSVNGHVAVHSDAQAPNPEHESGAKDECALDGMLFNKIHYSDDKGHTTRGKHERTNERMPLSDQHKTLYGDDIRFLGKRIPLGLEEDN
jgi:hypothetical protein